MKLNKFILALMAVSVTSLLAGTVNARTLRAAHTQVESDPTHAGFVAFADKLKELSAGELEVVIYPNGQLGGERECAEQLLNGALDIAKVGGQLVENFYPPYSVLNVPYLFKSYDHVKKFIKSDAAYTLLLHAAQDKGFRGLFFETAAPRSFYAKKPILKPEDLSGMKMRVPESQVSIDTVKLLGGQPTPMSSSELYSALQQSVMDGAENNFVYYVQARHFEVAPYFSEDEHSMPPNVVIMSQYTYDDLSEQEQKWVDEAAVYARDEQMRIYDEELQKSYDQAEKLGITVSKVDKEPFAAKTVSILNEVKARPNCGQIVDAIVALE